MSINETISQSMSLSFKNFVFKHKRNRAILFIALGLIIVQFSIFKYLYPFASYIHGDSFLYLIAADKNIDINTYPIGYSKFLRLFSVFTHSDTALVAFQYLSIQASVLLLLFTTFYFYTPWTITRNILLAFMVLNPLLLHLANLVSSDCLFVALSMTWFSLLLWIIHRPTTKLIIWHAMILFIAFTVRYNALIYPIIAAVAFWLSNVPIRKKIIGIAAGVLLCGAFICYTSYKYQKLTGYWQFSPFSGWQLANNAMYSYRYVDSADRKLLPKKFQVLDNMIREYFDSTRNVRKFPLERIQASTFYMWSPRLPLMKYRDNVFKRDTAVTELKKWASIAPFYKEYGLYIIKQYPLHFLRYFIWPNAQKYYAPPVEFLQNYNSGKENVASIAKQWFSYKNLAVRTRLKDKKVLILDLHPILSGIINVVMILSLIFYVVLKGWQYNKIFNKTIIIGSTVWLLNAGFTIVVSSAALRFQSFPLLLTTTFTWLLLDWMLQLMRNMNSKIENTKLKVNNLVADNDNQFIESNYQRERIKS